MTFPTHAFGREKRGSYRAFTLVEIMIVVVIIGLLAALAIPATRRVQRNAANSRFLSDLRTFSQAFETYALKNGRWPPDADPGVVPAGMEGELNGTAWTAPNSLGGQWEWNYEDSGITAAIATSAGTADDAQWTEIDAKLESSDGSNPFHSGHFRKQGSKYVFILAQ